MNSFRLGAVVLLTSLFPMFVLLVIYTGAAMMISNGLSLWSHQPIKIAVLFNHPIIFYRFMSTHFQQGRRAYQRPGFREYYDVAQISDHLTKVASTLWTQQYGLVLSLSYFLTSPWLLCTHVDTRTGKYFLTDWLTSNSAVLICLVACIFLYLSWRRARYTRGNM